MDETDLLLASAESRLGSLSLTIVWTATSMPADNPYAPPDSDIGVEAQAGLASLGARLGGAIIDGLISGAVLFPILFLSGYWDIAMAGEEPGLAVNAGLAVLNFVLFLAVHGYLLANHGQTVGKRLAKTRIVSVDTDEILPFGKVVGARYFPVMLVSQIPLVGQILSIIDVLFIFRSDRRCVHDMIAGTKVVVASPT